MALFWPTGGKDYLPSFRVNGEEHEFARMLGKGGQGQVGLYFRPDADISDPHDHVAVKFPAERSSSFGHEMPLLFGVDKRHIVQHLGFAKVEFDDGKTSPAIFMEYCDGGALSAQVKQHGPMSAPQVASHLAQAALGVRDSGLVHADIKPDNLFVKDGVTKVGDWGSAHPPGYHVPMFVGGSYGYHAPEVIRCPPFDEKRDVYALGASGYELASGERWRTFPKGATDFDAQDAIVKDTKRRSMGDPMLDAIIGHATNPDPVRRSSHVDLLADLAIYPEARAHYQQADREAIAKRLIERAAITPERSPDLDQVAAAGLLSDWSGGKALGQQLGQLARGPAVAGQGPVVVTPADPDQLAPATRFRGNFVAISGSAYDQQDAEGLRREAAAWLEAPAHGFSQRQSQYLTSIKQRCPHAADFADLPQRVSQDLEAAARTKDLHPGEVFVRLNHPNQSHSQGIAEGVAGGIVKHGTWTRFGADDRLLAVENYDDTGRLHGEQLEFNDQGRLSSRIPYVHGRRDGAAYTYDRGAITSTRTYQDGVALNHEHAASDDLDLTRPTRPHRTMSR